MAFLGTEYQEKFWKQEYSYKVRVIFTEIPTLHSF